MDQAERTRALVGECISRAHVETARGAALDDIVAACDACDYERAATLAFGRARAGEQVPTATIARILPGIELPAIAFALIALAPDRVSLLELVERRRFPQTREAVELEPIVVYAAWRAGADVARLIPELRRLSARQLAAESYALLATVAAAIEDPNVAAAAKPIASFAREYAKQVAEDAKSLDMTIDAVLASLPAEIENVAAAGFTVRSGRQVGRNDPCPCGSGLKFKKCCADKPQTRDVKPSPLPGVSWDDFLIGDRMSAEHVDDLALRDLARIEPPKLADKPLAVAFRRFVTAREWSYAERVVAEAVRREQTFGDDMRDELVVHLLECGELARAREHVAQLPPDLAKLFELELAVADGPPAAWPALLRAAREAAVDKTAAIELAYSLLRAEPALGIVAARACIGALHVDDPDLMLELVEDARDRLNVPPDDPAWDVLEALTVRRGHQKSEAEDQLKSSLAESTSRIDQLERTLAALRTELDHARTRPAVELVRTPEASNTLDSRVRELEALIREGNEERRELRKQLEAMASAEPARRDSPRARRGVLEETDDDVGENVELGARPLTIPRFERRAIDALEAVPTTVASETMRTIGTLAAGDGFAWRAVKQARDMVRPVLMARVGIHHRLIFRVENGQLDVLDLITREQLETTLKRLRSAR